jgi:hypothetical protein
MPFTLNVGFAGMCLLASEGDPEHPTAMHVLLPAAAGRVGPHGAGNEAEVHSPVLLYHTSNETEGSAEQKAATRLDIPNKLLDFVAQAKLLESPKQELEPPSAAVVDVGELGCSNVPIDFVNDRNPGPDVSVRASFKAGTFHVHDDAEGAYWTIKGKQRRMAIRVFWSMIVDDTRLVLKVKGLNGTSDGPKLTLYPDKDNNRINLWIMHSPESQIPKELPPRTLHKKIDPKAKAHHFAAYYELLSRPVPEFESDPGAVFLAAAAGAGSEVTCTTAKALIGP